VLELLQLTDNSQYVSSVQFCEAGRVFQLISGSAGTRTTNFRKTSDGFSLIQVLMVGYYLILELFY
jgi:hypothetical protein